MLARKNIFISFFSALKLIFQEFHSRKFCLAAEIQNSTWSDMETEITTRLQDPRPSKLNQTSKISRKSDVSCCKRTSLISTMALC